MDPSMKQTPSEAHPETMDFLSVAWCNFAVQALQPQHLQDQQPIVLLDKTPLDFKPPLLMDTSVKLDDSDFKSIPPWKSSNDVKSWIWMQQALHPELNYSNGLHKKWLPWKILPFKNISVKKWIKEIKQKRKEEERLKKAEVHAAISVAGVAAALAAIAAENSKKTEPTTTTTTKEAAVASAAALVAAQCTQVAEALGAKREHLSSIIGSAMTGTSVSDILTLTAAATTSLRGAATLKARTGCNKIMNGGAPVLPIEDKDDNDFDFEKCRAILAAGTELHVETPDGNFGVRSVSIIQNREAKVVLVIRKLNLLKSKKESMIMEVHAELYKDSSEEESEGTCYLLVLRSSGGIFKLDMGDDYHRYRTWASTIKRMLIISTTSPYSHYI